MSRKYLDRKMSSRGSRLSLSRSDSPGFLPVLESRGLDNFSISVRKYMDQSSLNP
jgi:hypothetical protein